MTHSRNLDFLVFIALSLSFTSCTLAGERGSIKALYDTKSEAEEASKAFNCHGAHKMGSKWMPCLEHGIHQHQHGMGN